MQNLQIAGIHQDLGQALQTHTEEKLQQLFKLNKTIGDIAVHYRLEHHEHSAELTVMTQGRTFHTTGRADDSYKALDDAMRKLGRRLRKFKTARLQRRQQRPVLTLESAVA